MQTPLPVELSPKQRALAIAEAERRQLENEKKGLLGRNGGPAAGARALEMHRIGCLGEMAAAVALDFEGEVFRDKVVVKDGADLPQDIEVKTRSRHYYDLIVQKNERPDKNMVLVTVEGGQILIHGWCVAGDVMEKRFLKDPAGGREAYFVPKSQLKPLESLKA